MPHKPTLLIDFDGTISQYNGWKGLDVMGPPLEKARHALLILERDFRIVIFTTRLAEYVERWLRAHGFPNYKVTNIKEAAFLIIDDRCICFNGQWTDELIQQIRQFTPHWKRKDELAASAGAEGCSSPTDPSTSRKPDPA